MAAGRPRAASGEHHHLFHLSGCHIHGAQFADRFPRRSPTSSLVFANIPVIRHRPVPTDPIIPLFVEARDLHLFDSRIGYILLHVEWGMPLGVILLTAFVYSIPTELDEAAWLDGASYPQYVARFIAPLAWPGLVITFLYSLLGVWNDIIGPVVLLASPNLFPVSRGVYSFYSSNQSAYTLLAAAVIIVSLPVAFLFVISQRQLLRATMGLR